MGLAKELILVFLPYCAVPRGSAQRKDDTFKPIIETYRSYNYDKEYRSSARRIRRRFPDHLKKHVSGAAATAVTMAKRKVAPLWEGKRKLGQSTFGKPLCYYQP